MHEEADLPSTTVVLLMIFAFFLLVIAAAAGQIWATLFPSKNGRFPWLD